MVKKISIWETIGSLEGQKIIFAIALKNEGGNGVGESEKLVSAALPRLHSKATILTHVTDCATMKPIAPAVPPLRERILTASKTSAL